MKINSDVASIGRWEVNVEGGLQDTNGGGVILCIQVWT